MFEGIQGPCCESKLLLKQSWFWHQTLRASIRFCQFLSWKSVYLFSRMEMGILRLPLSPAKQQEINQLWGKKCSTNIHFRLLHLQKWRISKNAFKASTQKSVRIHIHTNKECYDKNFRRQINSTFLGLHPFSLYKKHCCFIIARQFFYKNFLFIPTKQQRIDRHKSICPAVGFEFRVTFRPSRTNKINVIKLSRSISPLLEGKKLCTNCANMQNNR